MTSDEIIKQLRKLYELPGQLVDPVQKQALIDAAKIVDKVYLMVTENKVDDVCWRNYYGELAGLVEVVLALNCDPLAHIANCLKFTEALYFGGGIEYYKPIFVVPSESVSEAAGLLGEIRNHLKIMYGGANPLPEPEIVNRIESCMKKLGWESGLEVDQVEDWMDDIAGVSEQTHVQKMIDLLNKLANKGRYDSVGYIMDEANELLTAMGMRRKNA